MQKIAEELGRSELLEDHTTFFVVEIGMVLGLFHQLPKPRLASGVLDVRKLDANRAAIGLA